MADTIIGSVTAYRELTDSGDERVRVETSKDLSLYEAVMILEMAKHYLFKFDVLVEDDDRR